MKSRNLSKGTFYFPLKSGETIDDGAVYEIVSGKAQKVTSTITGKLIGVCIGGDNIRKGYVMLNIDPTTVYKEAYSSTAPTIGEYTDKCKLVINVNEADKEFEYLLRKEAE